MTKVYVYKVDGQIIGVSGSYQNAINGIGWIEEDADDPEIHQWMTDHKVISAYTD